jgi:S-adenosylmethionine decarboxylase proenzyme
MPFSAVKPLPLPSTIRRQVTDAYGCRGSLDDLEAIESAIRRGCDAVKAHVVKVTSHHYEPIGVTVVALLRESHVCVTTWPEHGYAIVDVFLCNETMDARVVWQSLRVCLAPTRIRHRRFAHHVGPARIGPIQLVGAHGGAPLRGRRRTALPRHPVASVPSGEHPL